MIYELSGISVNKFMQAMFNKVYDDIENWDQLFMAYIDVSGIGQTRQKDLLVQQYSLQNRLAFIHGTEETPGYLEFQRLFYMQMDEPCTGVFGDLRTYGHRLTWDASNPTDFLNQLKRIDAKERRNVAELDRVIKDLQEFERKGNKAVKEDKQARTEFVQRLNQLNKFGYTIDREKTDMETVSLMINEFDRENEMLNQKQP